VGTVNIAELKDQLSSFLHRVRAGEELVIRDRNLPIAKIVPLRGEEMDPEELSLVASGQMALPKQELDQKRFWTIGGPMKRSRKIANAIKRAIAAEREDYAGVLGHKRHRSHLRARAKRQDR
jgi:prevent-host-death family protein